MGKRGPKAGLAALHEGAEFVDEAAVLARVRELGFDFAQGYFIGRPQLLSSCTASAA